MTDEKMTEELEETVVTEETPAPRMTVGAAMAALKAALSSGSITKSQYNGMRSDFGITQAMFTRKSHDPEKAKRKRKAAKMARRATRNSLRGQKMHKGTKR